MAEIQNPKTIASRELRITEILKRVIFRPREILKRYMLIIKINP